MPRPWRAGALSHPLPTVAQMRTPVRPCSGGDSSPHPHLRPRFQTRCLCQFGYQSPRQRRPEHPQFGRTAHSHRWDRVVDFRPMSAGKELETPEEHAYWPVLPAGCPPSGAVQRTGTFYRFVNGTEQDWKSKVQLNGEEWCDERPSTPLCRFHSISIYSTLEAARRRKLLGGWIAKCQIVEFTMTAEMGVVRESNPSTHHCDWWPHGTDFVPPPECKVVG